MTAKIEGTKIVVIETKSIAVISSKFQKVTWLSSYNSVAS